MPLSPIQPTIFSSSVTPLEGSCTKQVSSSLTTPSTIQQFGRRRPWGITKWISGLWAGILNWFRSWFNSKNSEDAPIYYKIVGAEDGGKYRLLKDGKKTDNALLISENTAFLSEISFPEKWAYASLPKMLRQVMRDERIAFLHTRSLPHARVLWSAGLHTDAVLNLDVDRGSQVERFFCELVRIGLAQRKHLDERGVKGLEAIEEQIVMMLVSDAFNCTGNVSEEFQNAIFEFKRLFPGIDFARAAARLREKQELPTVIAMIDHFIGEIPEAFPHGLSTSNGSVDLPFSSLCAIASSLDIPFDQQVCQSLNVIITFTQEPPHAD